ncbi:MAG: hypothetical protein J6D31_06910 [Clostridia bacterium]|nr:hypothetical protein [Clostridia bacterium]
MKQYEEPIVQMIMLCAEDLMTGSDENETVTDVFWKTTDVGQWVFSPIHPNGYEG